MEQTYFFNHSEVFNIEGMVNRSAINLANLPLIKSRKWTF
jgi:hypothetical protein